MTAKWCLPINHLRAAWTRSPTCIRERGRGEIDEQLLEMMNRSMWRGRHLWLPLCLSQGLLPLSEECRGRRCSLSAGVVAQIPGQKKKNLHYLAETHTGSFTLLSPHKYNPPVFLCFSVSSASVNVSHSLLLTTVKRSKHTHTSAIFAFPQR